MHHRGGLQCAAGVITRQEAARAGPQSVGECRPERHLTLKEGVRRYPVMI